MSGKTDNLWELSLSLFYRQQGTKITIGGKEKEQFLKRTIGKTSLKDFIRVVISLSLSGVTLNTCDIK